MYVKLKFLHLICLCYIMYKQSNINNDFLKFAKKPIKNIHLNLK